MSISISNYLYIYISIYIILYVIYIYYIYYIYIYLIFKIRLSELISWIQPKAEDTNYPCCANADLTTAGAAMFYLHNDPGGVGWHGMIVSKLEVKLGKTASITNSCFFLNNVCSRYH